MNRSRTRRSWTLIACGVVAWCAATLHAQSARQITAAAPGTDARPAAEASGGAATVFDHDVTAFGRALANLDPLRWNEFRAGKARFLREWPERGPWADAASCADCHFHDGRGPKSDARERGLSHLLRLGRTPAGSDRVYGIQLRRTGYGVPAPGQFVVQWEEIAERYPSGESYSLRRPAVRAADLAYGPLDRDTRLSLRVPPAVFGLGLLEAVPDAEILAVVDADDANGDGVSGRAQRVRDPASGQIVLGRFGWKAGQPSLAAQSAAALAEDLGVTSPLAPARVGDALAAGERAPEIGSSETAALVRYLRALAVPGRRDAQDAAVREGETLFMQIGCAGCHRQELRTGELAGWPELSNQIIRPYTDLLLHDLGPALADEVSEGVASGREWRTPPLWALGLLPTVSGDAGLLHDGRARTLEEAILWHGGEAERVRRAFEALPRDARRALIRMLESL